jgi:ribosomal protein S18 acetylase RimI-like enzyme
MFGPAQLPNGITLRATTASDSTWERRIHDASRSDLLLIDGEADFVQSIVDFQYRAKGSGHADAYPNAHYYMIEKSADVVGRLMIDFGHNEVRIVDITILPQWHGKGIGTTVLQAMQQVAGRIAAPVVLAVQINNINARKLYQSLGFKLDPDCKPSQTHLLMRWDPTANMMATRVFMSDAKAAQ